MGPGNQPPLWGGLDAVRVPTLAVAGELDEKYVRILRRMSSLNPRIRTAVVPGAGHNVRLESPSAYLELLQTLLAASQEDLTSRAG